MKLRSIIEKKKITPYRLAAISGVSQPTISRILTGKTPEPKTGTLRKIAAGLGVSVSELM